MNNSKIQTVSEFTFQGLHINTKLDWDTHVNVLDNKISGVLGIIKNYRLYSRKKFSYQ